MPTVSADMQSAIDWLTTHAIPLLVTAVVLSIAYRWARPALHRLLVGAMLRQQRELGDDEAAKAETERRMTTLEDLLSKVIQFVLIGAVVVVIFGVFDLWPFLAGLGLVLAALTLAGQSIILDYLMGLLILVEGQYFKGDVVQLGTVEGVVEEVGLRRTIVRDVRGTLHSVSNGTIRVSSNRTRTYAAATVDLDGIAGSDVDAVIEMFDQIGLDLSKDERLAPLLLDVPKSAGTIRLSATGATVRLAGRVRPEARAEVETEMRRRVAAGLTARGIEPIRPGAVGAGQTIP